jgi:hypothetical protein
MPEMVTGNPEFRLTGIILHTLLDATNGDGTPRTGPFSDQEDLFGSGCGPCLEIVCKSKESVITHIDDPIFASLPIFDDDFSLFEVQHSQGEIGDFLYTKPTAEHQHEHGPIPIPLHNVKEGFHLLVPQVPGEGLGHFDGMALSHRIHDG